MYKRQSEPRGLAIDPDGGLWVADSGNDRVQKFAPDGQVTTCFPGGRDVDLSCPNAVAVDSRGSVYVSDSLNHRIVRLAPAGEQLED
ncbi:MAG: NHL repeat-containing protein [Proteobacteria bacterium]|nr:NHL repeat-containing protein [Pseudomonadota bacterium]